MKMAEASDVCIPENVKKLVRAVLLSKIGGVPIKKFPTDYKDLIGENFPMLSLGFSSLLACMQAMPDVVRIIGDNQETCTLLGIGDDTSFMSGPAIKAQYPVEDNQQKRKRGRRQNGTKKEKLPKNQLDQKGTGQPPASKKYPDLVPNIQGLYAVVVKGIHDDYTADVVNNLFSLNAVVINQNRFSNFYFFRFATLHEAEKILDKFDGNMVNGTKIGVTPAHEKGHHIHRKKSSSPQDNHYNEKDTTECSQSVNVEGDGNEKKKDRNMDKVDDQKNFNKNMNGKDKTNGKKMRNMSNQQTRFQNEKQLPAQLEVIERTPSLPQLSNYSIHLDNMNKSMTQCKLLEIFGHFQPTKCHLGKPSKKRTHVHADMTFKCLEDIKEVSEYLKHNCIMGEQIISHFSFQTLKKLGVDLEEMGIKTVLTTSNSKFSESTNDDDWNEIDFTSNPKQYTETGRKSNHQDSASMNMESKSTNDDDWNEIDSTSDPTQCTETGRISNHQDSASMSMESVLKSLPNGVPRLPLHASDSEGSTTCSTRRRRPCILDFLEDETT